MEESTLRLAVRNESQHAYSAESSSSGTRLPFAYHSLRLLQLQPQASLLDNVEKVLVTIILDGLLDGYESSYLAMLHCTRVSLTWRSPGTVDELANHIDQRKCYNWWQEGPYRRELQNSVLKN